MRKSIFKAILSFSYFVSTFFFTSIIKCFKVYSTSIEIFKYGIEYAKYPLNYFLAPNNINTSEDQLNNINTSEDQPNNNEHSFVISDIISYIIKKFNLNIYQIINVFFYILSKILTLSLEFLFSIILNLSKFLIIFLQNSMGQALYLIQDIHKLAFFIFFGTKKNRKKEFIEEKEEEEPIEKKSSSFFIIIIKKFI
jgi:hypothetical protein